MVQAPQLKAGPIPDLCLPSSSTAFLCSATQPDNSKQLKQKGSLDRGPAKHPRQCQSVSYSPQHLQKQAVTAWFWLGSM